MIHFPATCVDNFYSNPDKIREWALSLDYHSATNGEWPGKRSDKLHRVDPVFFELFCKKLFSIYFDVERNDINWIVHSQFQLIEPFDQDYNSMKNTGWVHYDDDAVFGGLIYLTPNIDPNCGTSIFKQKEEIPEHLNGKTVKQSFYKTGNDENYEDTLAKHNSVFDETIKFNNIYNRCISFDGQTAHKANSFHTNEPRLTQVFFVDKIDITSKWPIARHKDYL